jgi:hypothetical protein
MRARSFAVALVVALLAAVIAPLRADAVTPARHPAAAADERLVMIGDSVTNGSRRQLAAALRPVYPDLLIDAADCRGLVTSCRTSAQPTAPDPGLSVLARSADRPGGRLVIALGYNDAPSSADIDRALVRATAAGFDGISWVGLSTRRGGRTGPFGRFNDRLRQAQSRWPDLQVLDWDAASAGADRWFADDVHLTAAGSAAFAEFVADHLDVVVGPRCESRRVRGRAALASSPQPTATTASGGLEAVTPIRRLDTRTSLPLGAGRTMAIELAGWGPVPASATGVMLNVTAVDPCGPGFVTVHPCRDGAPPLASNLNVVAGQTVANLVAVALGTGGPAGSDGTVPTGSVCITSQPQLDVVVDVVGWWGPSTAGVTGRTPERLLDTRTAARPRAGGIVTVTVPLTAPATAAVVTVTAVASEGPGFVTAWPAGADGVCRDDDRPFTSTLNPLGPDPVANLALVGLGAGRFCLVSSRSAHLIADVTATVGAGPARLRGTTPTRVLDTRDGGTRVGPVGATAVSLEEAAPGASVVGVNLTTVGSDRPGYLSAWPAEPDGSCVAHRRPFTSVLNHLTGAVVAGYAMVGVGGKGRICVFSLARTDLVVDVTAVGSANP